MKNLLILFIASISLAIQLPAQSVPCDVNTIQPKIMVIPYTKEGEDIRTIIDSDINLRVAITKVKEAFDNRGFTTVDFVGKLKSANETNVFTLDSKEDIKSQLILYSGADIYVETEFAFNQGTTGNSARIVLTAYEASTGNSLSNKTASSNINVSKDISMHVEAAVAKIAEEFLNTMQMKFNDIVVNGKSVVVDFSFNENSDYDMDYELPNGNTLGDDIEIWIGDHAVKNNFSTAGQTSKRYLFTDVRIPLRNPETCKNYTTNNFSTEIIKYLKSLGIAAKKDNILNKIVITIN